MILIHDGAMARLLLFILLIVRTFNYEEHTVMKRLIKFLVKLLSHEKRNIPFVEDIHWENLDGAEFTVIYPQASKAVAAE